MTDDAKARLQRINGEMLDSSMKSSSWRSTTIGWPSC